MNDMTPQEIFDKVVNHLRAQGAKSMDGDACRYRSKDGMQCAAGCLIPDSDYSSDMEDKNVAAVSFFKNVYGPALDLIWRLQGTHDRSPLTEWELDWESVANDYDLTYTPVSEVAPLSKVSP